MLHRLLFVSVLSLLVAGCEAQPDPGTTATSSPPETAATPATGDTVATPEAGVSTATAGSAASAPESAPANASPAASGDTPAPVTQDVVLTPDSTKIQFVGTHVGEPKPRTGTFAKFQGTAGLEGDSLRSVQVDIETASLTTDIDKLTNHLKSPDFFDVNQFPQAKFVSTAIEPAGDGMVTITGDLTLLETTKSISFPATVSTADGLKLNAEFVIDRTQFGMTYGEGQVVHDVTLTVTVGQ